MSPSPSIAWLSKLSGDLVGLHESVIMSLPGLVLKVGPANLFIIFVLSDSTLRVAEAVFYSSYIVGGGMTLFLPLTIILASSTLSLLCVWCSHELVIEGSFICVLFDQWLI
jgi:hypothetical protein